MSTNSFIHGDSVRSVNITYNVTLWRVRCTIVVKVTKPCVVCIFDLRVTVYNKKYCVAPKVFLW